MDKGALDSIMAGICLAIVLGIIKIYTKPKK